MRVIFDHDEAEPGPKLLEQPPLPGMGLFSATVATQGTLFEMGKLERATKPAPVNPDQEELFQ